MSGHEAEYLIPILEHKRPCNTIVSMLMGLFERTSEEHIENCERTFRDNADKYYILNIALKENQFHSHFNSAIICTVSYNFIKSHTKNSTFCITPNIFMLLESCNFKMGECTRERTKLFREISCDGERLRKRLTVNVENGHLTERSCYKVTV